MSSLFCKFAIVLLFVESIPLLYGLSGVICEPGGNDGFVVVVVVFIIRFFCIGTCLS